MNILSPVRSHVLIAVALIGVLGAPRAGRCEGGGESRTRNVFELQLGGGIVTGVDGVGPMAQVHGRFALWRTIGLGVYVAGMHNGSVGIENIVPVCGRLNLSLPFWDSFEPVMALGVGSYTSFQEGYNGQTRSDSGIGYHVALSLLFPHRKHGFGLEGALHLTGDPNYSDDSVAIGDLVVTYLIR